MTAPQSRLESDVLVVHLPMRLGEHRGRKRIRVPNGTLVKALARAWRWRTLLDRGVHASVSEIAEAERISKSYVSRLLRLALLAPDLVGAIPRRAPAEGAEAGGDAGERADGVGGAASYVEIVFSPGSNLKVN
jgi:hypothetical protein